MLFNSLHFLAFFPIVTALYFLTPFRWRWIVLLVSSCYFYMAFIPAYLLILFLLIGIDYTAGIAIEGATGARRRLFLVVSLIANITVLAVFKYFNFASANLTTLLQVWRPDVTLPLLRVILPIGLSFHTFQSMAYTIEVYQGRFRAERHLGYYAVYVLFYPQLVAGPIERPQNLLPQFHTPHSFDWTRITRGLQLMLWGAFKKIVIADRLALVVNAVYDHPRDYTGLPLALATYCFAFQILCDFSGYSDIAIGAGEVMGIKMMQNFNRPYAARSIADFWSRWHISLSTWFRDYLYIPLGGNRVRPVRRFQNLLIVFLVSGLWHGANWTFVVWGALHGTYLITAILTQQWRDRVARALLGPASALRLWIARIITFHLVTFAWIFFRARSLSDAGYVISHLPTGWHLRGNNLGAVVTPYLLVISLGSVAALLLAERAAGNGDVRLALRDRPGAVRWGSYYAVILLLLCFGAFHNPSQFIYFQF